MQRTARSDDAHSNQSVNWSRIIALRELPWSAALIVILAIPSVTS